MATHGSPFGGGSNRELWHFSLGIPKEKGHPPLSDPPKGGTLEQQNGFFHETSIKTIR